MSSTYKLAIAKMGAKKPPAKGKSSSANTITKIQTKPSPDKPIVKSTEGSDSWPNKQVPEREICFCNSVRSVDEPHLRCLMKTKHGLRYCPIHLAQKSIIDYTLVDNDIFDRDERIVVESSCLPSQNPQLTNSILRKINLAGYDIQSRILDKNVVSAKNVRNGKIANTTTMREQKVSTVENVHKENEEELEIKLLILVNDDEYCDKISELVGPVFKNITLSEDEQDPVTLDTIWTINNGNRVAASVNKYYLFSYIDSKGKIRCLTIFTIYNMIQDGTFIHPITMEPIPTKDINRAKELIDLYQTKIGLFSEQDDSNLSPEFKLKNRLTKLFKKFHIHSIYFEENWLISINDKARLFKIIRETEKLVSNNLVTINPNLHGFKIFQKKESSKRPVRGKGKAINNNNDGDGDDDSIIKLQEYIVIEWEKLIEASDTPQNQIPIWIIASGLSFAVPEVKQKFPDLEIML